MSRVSRTHVLKTLGHTVPTGRGFSRDGRRGARAIGGAYAYGRRLGLPVLLKPNDGSGDQHEVNAAPGLDTHERAPGWSRRRVERLRKILLALDRDRR